MTTGVPPHDLDAEGAVLSACLNAPERVDELRSVLADGEAFYADANRRIFEAMVALADGGTTVDVVSVAKRLREIDRLAQVGGTPYLAQLMDATPQTSNYVEHAHATRDLWRTRRVIRLSQMRVGEAYAPRGVGTGEHLQNWLAAFESELSEIAHSVNARGLRTYGEVSAELRAQIEAARQSGGLSGTTTGFTDVDKQTTGAHGGDLFIIGGRPGQGKTALATCMALAQARDGLAVPFFSLEMPATQLAARVLSIDARIPLQRIREASFDSASMNKIDASLQRMSAVPLFIDDTATITVPDIRAKVRRLRMEIEAGKHAGVRGLGGVFVDYLQLMHSPARGQSREQEVAGFSRSLKLLAKELNVPVFALSQLNRKSEEHGSDKRPSLANLRESGALEQDADAVIFVHRPAYYDRTDDPALKGWAEIIIAKQRNGPTGTVKLAFAEEYARFDNYARMDGHAYEPPPHAAPVDHWADFDDDLDR